MDIWPSHPIRAPERRSAMHVARVFGTPHQKSTDARDQRWPEALHTDARQKQARRVYEKGAAEASDGNGESHPPEPSGNP